MAIADRSNDFNAVLARLTSALGELKQEVERLAQTNVTTPDEARQLQEQAESGELGPEMEQAAALVAAGSESWESLLSGRSPNSVLLFPIMEANASRYGAEFRAKIVSGPR
ncbi:hypothetical protein [Nocardia brevicatena]|uniref:hypothetical protein n=1 Tax=Nocardia brevicatena TaxID=37327 RepID=UPI0002F627D9|nr:hypothetical protein [Nocardia brevicatena]